MNKEDFQTALMVEFIDLLALTPDLRPDIGEMKIPLMFDKAGQDQLLVATLTYIGVSNN